MKRFDLWKLSLLNVFSAPVRSGLTVLGFAIGVAAILAVLTLGEAGKAQVESEMGRLGIDKIWINAQADMRQGTGSWVGEMAGVSAEEMIYLPADVQNMAGTKCTATVVGCSWTYVQRMPVETHRIREVVWNTQKQIAFVGEKVAKELHACVGDVLNIGTGVFQICGIIKESDGFSSVPADESVLIPLHAASAWTAGNVHEIQLTAEKNVSVEKMQKLVDRMLESQGIGAKTLTMQVQMEAANSVIATFVNVLKWVALVCVLVGGIGIMNILLISVRERKREIGVMKSLGTTSKQICILFLLEALVYAGIGGLLGIGFGMVLIYAAGTSIELTARASLTDCTTVFACAMGTGLLFGVLPAFRASCLSCVDALRQE